MPKRILVTGATGLLGGLLVAALQKSDNELVATTRDRAFAKRKLGNAVHCVQWDYLNEAFPAEALEGVSAVYHLMGENIGSGRWTRRRKAALRGSRILSAQKLVAALTDDVTDFLCASAIGIYPGDSHDAFDEHSILPPAKSFITRLCTDWELAATEADTPTRRQVSLRIGLVLAESGMLAPLVPLYRLGLGGPIGDGNQILPWVHIEDLVDMLQFVLAHRELHGPVNLVGPAPVSLETFGQDLARVVARRNFLRVPEALVRIALGEASALLLSSYNVLPTRLTESGFQFRHATAAAALEDVVKKFY
jgi:uncharacterized protein (TIGR01777 family)